LTLPSGKRPDSLVQNRKHSVGSMKLSEGGWLWIARSISYTRHSQALRKMKMKPEKYHTGATLPRAKLA